MAQRQNSKSITYRKRKPASKNMIFGIHPVLEAIEAGKSIDKLFVQRGIKNDQISTLIEVAGNQNIYINKVPVEKLNRLTGKNHQGVVCFISPVEYVDLENLIPQLFENGLNPLVLILDRITDVRNFGAITRSAENFGVNAIVIPKNESAQINEDAIKASAGAIFNINICKESSLEETVKFLKECGFRIVACTEKSKDLIDTIDFCTPTALILGSEGEGIHSTLLKLSDEQAVIPLIGKTGSLNVSVAAGIALYQVIRLRSINNC